MNKNLNIFFSVQKSMQPLLGVSINRATGGIDDNKHTIGAPADSYFEYLLKYWILRGKKVSSPTVDTCPPEIVGHPLKKVVVYDYLGFRISFPLLHANHVVVFRD